MKPHPYIIPKIESWPISLFYKDRPRVVRKLTVEIIEYFKNQSDYELPQLLSQTIYSEKIRARSKPLKVDPVNDLSYWTKLESDLSASLNDLEKGEKIQEEILSKIIRRYAEEITGNFVPKTFLFARKTLTLLFKLVYNPFVSKKTGLFWGSRDALLDKFTIEGPLDHIRGMFDKGTVLVLPTHFSNLDSILVGYAIEMLTGMPAFSYGAGLNLYDYELLAYYMSRLGAYKVDRRKKNATYLQSIKQFSKISIQEGLNSIFFPGGGRTRSGMLEKDLKLGLLSTLVDSQNEFYLRNFNKKIIVVPLVISYHYTLEASSLIEQYLRRTGKQNYMSQRKPKITFMKKLRFVMRFFKSDSNVTLSFGKPIDIFGNPLDENANSIRHGKMIDIKEYFKSGSEISHDHQRNMVYTRNLALALAKSYACENVVLTSHVVAFTAFQIFKKKNANLDIFALVSLPCEFFTLSFDQFFEHLNSVLEELKRKASRNEIKLSRTVAEGKGEDILEDAIKNINCYHFCKVLRKESRTLKTEDLKLLFYYSNRLEGYRLDEAVQVSPVKSHRLTKSIF